MAETSTDPHLRVARPAFRVAGQEQSTLAGALLELSIQETTQGLYRCEATFGNWGPINGDTDFLYFDRKVLEFGKAFQVLLGNKPLFDGRITALEARFPEASPPELTVLAEDRFQDLRMTRRTTTYVDSTDADILQQIAHQHGLTPSVNVQGPTHKVIAQVNQSDLAFLRERCRGADAELWMDGSTLHAQARTGRAGDPLKLGRGNELLEFTVLADLAGQRSAVTVSGWDVSGKAEITHEATDSVLGGELGGDTSGASLLASGLGRRKEAVVHTVPLTRQEAQARAEAYFKLQARRFVMGRGVAVTDAKLRAGAKVQLDGLGPLFSGSYYVTETKHLFDGARGLRTEFAAERAGLGQPQ